MFHFFDPLYLIMISPALLLAVWANYRVKSTYAAASQIPAPLSGAAAARHILDSAGLQNVEIEQIPGELSDHYDSSAKVLRLSSDVFDGRSLAAVGIAAHESGHALQDARNYSPMRIRNAVVPAASLGSNAGICLIFIGAMFQYSRFAPQLGHTIILAGIALFACVVFFQLINLPVEFNASSRAKAQLVSLGIVPAEEMPYVNRVLNAAALTYVAATLQAVMILLYYILRFAGGSDRN